jgi:Ca2+/Na+ antiporter
MKALLSIRDELVFFAVTILMVFIYQANITQTNIWIVLAILWLYFAILVVYRLIRRIWSVKKDLNDLTQQKDRETLLVRVVELFGGWLTVSFMLKFQGIFFYCYTAVIALGILSACIREVVIKRKASKALSENS